MKKLIGLLLFLGSSSALALSQWGGNVTYGIGVSSYLPNNHSFLVAIWPTNSNSSYLYCDNQSQVIEPNSSVNYTTHCYLSHYDNIKNIFTTTLNSYVQDTTTKLTARCNIHYTLDPNTLNIPQQHFFIINENRLGTLLSCKQVN